MTQRPTATRHPLAITQQPAFRNLPSPACADVEGWAYKYSSIPCFLELSDAEVEVAEALGRITP